MAVVAGLAVVSLLGASRSWLGLAGEAGALLMRPLVLIPVTLLLVASVACRVVAGRRSLASRTRLVVLAPDLSDRCSTRSCAARPSSPESGGWSAAGSIRAARAVRVLLDADEEGRMRYSLSVPEPALPAVRSALGVLTGCRHRCSSRALSPARPPGATRRGGGGRSRSCGRSFGWRAEQRAAGQSTAEPRSAAELCEGDRAPGSHAW